jgi:hypothetical protein
MNPTSTGTTRLRASRPVLESVIATVVRVAAVVEEAAEDAVVEAADATMAEVVVGTDTVATVVGIAAAADTRSRCQVLGVRSWGSTASFLRRAGPTGQKKQNEAAIRGSRLLYLRIQTV